MKKTLLALSLAALSGNALAIENGTAMDWSKHDDMVYMSCTGTVIAGKWILTAGHCEPSAKDGIHTQKSGSIYPSQVDNHPDMNTTGIDIALWELPSMVDTTTATFLSMRNVEEGDEIKITGFGHTEPNLNYAIQTATSQLEGLAAKNLLLKYDTRGMSIAGDSGAPYLDSDNKIVGIHNSGGIDPEEKTNAEGTRLYYAKDFILDTVNGWHYPTQAVTATSGGSVTVKVQSLHRDTFMDNATYSGDVTVTGGTCLGATVEPFDICTYEIESANGYEGTVTLDDGEVITINKGHAEVKPPVVNPPSNKKDSGGSGGSLGFFSLLGLMVIGLSRKLKVGL